MARLRSVEIFDFYDTRRERSTASAASAHRGRKSGKRGVEKREKDCTSLVPATVFTSCSLPDSAGIVSLSFFLFLSFSLFFSPSLPLSLSLFLSLSVQCRFSFYDFSIPPLLCHPPGGFLLFLDPIEELSYWRWKATKMAIPWYE